MSKTIKLMCAAGIVGAAALSGGCNDDITVADVKGNWSPDLHSMARSNEQHEIMHARTIDTNGRQVWDDISKVLLLNRPSRLSEYPVP